MADERNIAGCDASAPNCIPIIDGWNYWVRLYGPRKEILDGTWKFPEPTLVPDGAIKTKS